MRAVVQRVSRARVTIAGRVAGEIGNGILVLIAVRKEDTQREVAALARKLVNLRIFDDEAGKMNRSLLAARGAALIVSQFTLYGDVRRGLRPGFEAAAPLDQANDLYEKFVGAIRQSGVEVATGVFQARMTVELANEGPVTILLDTERQL